MTKTLMIELGGGGLTLDGDAQPYEEVPPQLDTNAIARIYPPSGVSETPAGLLGHSGASIEILGDRVVKSGSDPRIYEQARFCSQHQGVCPTVYKIITGYRRYAYEMERLDELPNLTNPDLTGHIIDIAYREFWRHKAGTTNRVWRSVLSAWAVDKGFRWLVLPLNTLYTDDCAFMQVDIHGDLTLANTMIRPATREHVLIDPLPPTEKIPPLIEVDFGKLMQSALGWESLLLTGKAVYQEALVDLIYRQTRKFKIPPKLVDFWTMVHLARIIPYAKNPDVIFWAESNSARIADALSL